MAESIYRCDDEGWKTPKPDCTCGAGNDAPWSAHYSKRFGGRPELLERYATSTCVDGPFPENAPEDVQTWWTFISPNGFRYKHVADCALYTWHKGCHGSTPDGNSNRVHARACPHNDCKHGEGGKRAQFNVCDNHGGDKEAVRRMVAHLAQHHAPATKSAA